MADYKVVDAEKLDADLTGMADEVRTLADTTSKMSLEVMKGNIAEANEKVDSQSEIIAQIKTALQGKAGSGGASIPENAIYTITEYNENGYPKKVKYQIPQELDNTTIPSYAFGNQLGNNFCLFAQNVEEVEIPETVTKLSAYSFTRCFKLKRISNYDNIIDVGDYALFLNAQIFELKYLPPKIETIGLQAFNGAFRSANLVIPETVKSIGQRAFYNLNNANIVFKGTPETLHAEALYGAAKNNIYCPWAEGEVANAPWGATNATIHYNTQYDENGNPITE